MSDRRYPDLPTTGRYRGNGAQPSSGMTVRAPEAPSPADHSGATGPRTYRLLYNQSKGLYRLYASGDAAAPGFTELEQYPNATALKTTLRHWPNLLRFVVYEDRDTGAVLMDRLANLSANWIDEGHFDRFILFNDANDAERYASERREALSEATASRSQKSAA